MVRPLQENVYSIKKKAGLAYKKLNLYLQTHRIFIFFLTKKMAGKSTYIQYLMETFPKKFINLSFGETVRNLQEEIRLNKNKAVRKWSRELITDLEKSSVSNLLSLPSVKTIFKNLLVDLPPDKSVLFDGIPRKLNQIPLVIKKSHQLGNQDYRVIFLEIDVANEILDARLESRRICPKCGFTDNILTPVLENISFNNKTKEFYLVCPKCGIPLIRKMGDQLSPAIYKRRQEFEKIAKELKKRVCKEQSSKITYIRMRTDIPVNKFQENQESLNLITEYSKDKKGRISAKKKPQTATWQGKPVYSLNAPTATARIIQKLAATIS